MLGGRQLTEEEITGLLIAVLFAGQHTSSITTSWTGIFMAANKVGRCCMLRAGGVGTLEMGAAGVWCVEATAGVCCVTAMVKLLSYCIPTCNPCRTASGP